MLTSCWSAQKDAQLYATSVLSKLGFLSGHPQQPASSWGWSVMQGSPRRRSAVSIFSNFFQGRRHSSSDPLLRIIQRRRSSAVEVLSSSTHRVMVAVSSLSPEELDATFPQSHVSSAESSGGQDEEDGLENYGFPAAGQGQVLAADDTAM